jgi:hypothetical protein
MPRAKNTNRADRTPLGTHRSKLTVQDRDPAYQYRYINDSPGRVEQARAGGYEFVDDQKTGDTGETNTGLGSRTAVRAGTNADGSGMNAYLMRIPREFYEEDQAEKEKVNQKVDDAINGGAIEGEPGKEGRYVPSSGISYKP